MFCISSLAGYAIPEGGAMSMLAFAITYRYSQASFILLGALLLVWSYWRLAKYREGVLRDFLGNRQDSDLTLKRSVTYSAWKTILLALSWLLATIALMGPVWNQTSAPKVIANEPLSTGQPIATTIYQQTPPRYYIRIGRFSLHDGHRYADRSI